MSAGGENGSANGKRAGGGAVELWEGGEHPKEPARRVERPDVAAKIAKVSEELKQDVRPPPPPAMIAVGGVIPPGDYAELRAAGAVAIFGPGTELSEAALSLLDIVTEHRSEP